LLEDWNEIIEKVKDVEKDDCGDYVAHVGKMTLYIGVGSGMSQVLTTKNGIEYGRGIMKTNVPFDFPFVHNNSIQSIAVRRPAAGKDH